MEKPTQRPAQPSFSSGPCAKRPGWEAAALTSPTLGRSHRSSIGKKRLAEAIDKTREILGVPDDHLIGIVPASDTGAVEIAMWNLLGAKPLTVLGWESFGLDWVKDAVDELKLEPTVMKADYGALPDLAAVDPAHDTVFTWNGTTSGVRVPNADWISDARDGLTICDATSAAFAQDLDWSKLDVVTYSWQKILGGEAAHGMLILSPNAVKRLETYTPDRPLPKLFRMTKGGKINTGLFEGATINTPSMLCVEDYLQCLDWAESLGGWRALKARSDASLGYLEAWVEATPWVDFLCGDSDVRSNTGVTFKITDPRVAAMADDDQKAFVKKFVGLLEADGVAYDFNAYRDAPAGLRIWCGATVEPADVAKLTPWLDWAFAETAATLEAA